MIVIGVYKRHSDDEENRETLKKPYVWLHPPAFVELSYHDELYVLCDKDPKETIAAVSTDNMRNFNDN
jgi:hypothetical protein